MAHRFRTASKTSPAAKQRARDYNTPEYRAAGKQATALVASGHAACWRCHRPIPANARRGPDWQLGHDDHDRRIIRGPECTRCNRIAAARAGYRASRGLKPRRAQSRAW